MYRMHRLNSWGYTVGNSNAMVLILKVILSMGLGFVVTSCGDHVQTPEQKEYSVNPEHLSQVRMFFGHQSVGYNILDGVRQVLGSSDSNLQIEEVESCCTKKAEVTDSKGIILHSKIGKNRYPRKKITDFTDIVRRLGSSGQEINLVGMKLCYVDIDRNTDVKALLQEYAISVDTIRAAFPGIQVIHFTTPLKTAPTDMKTVVKRWLGVVVETDEDNIRRNKYNELLRARYGDDEVFDIARLEATSPEGLLTQFKRKGKRYPAMATEYSSDGGHLNEEGKVRLGREFLRFLERHFILTEDGS